jgi:hypothetical protein
MPEVLEIMGAIVYMAMVISLIPGPYGQVYKSAKVLSSIRKFL